MYVYVFIHIYIYIYVHKSVKCRTVMCALKHCCDGFEDGASTVWYGWYEYSQILSNIDQLLTRNDKK